MNLGCNRKRFYKWGNPLISSLLLFISTTTLYSHKLSIKPDSYTKEGYCIVTSKDQQATGLLRFNSKEEFLHDCNGKMYFLYDNNDDCRYFTMKNMKFDIYIEDKNGKSKFLIGELKNMCGKTIIESID